jgi:hypothetical protein
MPANEERVPGHYQSSGYMHWDLVLNTGMGYFEGNITKYIVRWRKKNGLEDLQKALHYLDKLIEVSNIYREFNFSAVCTEVEKFQAANKLEDAELDLVMDIATWRNRSDLCKARDLLRVLIRQATVEAKPVPVSDSNKHAPRAEPGEVGDPIPQVCPHCDFGSGQRGMDRCAKCDGSGSVFLVKGKLFPNTEDGFKAAVAACGRSKITNEQVVAALREETPLNKARRQFSNWSAKIEQAGMQRKPPTPIEMRRMEFEAAKAIVEAFIGASLGANINED